MNTTLIRKHSLLLAAGTALAVAASTAVFARSGQPGLQAPPGVDPATHTRHVQQGTMGAERGGGVTNAMPSIPLAGTDAQHSGEYTDLVYQIANLRAQVAQLQGVLAQRLAAQPTQAQAAGAPSGMGMKSKPMGAEMQGKMSKDQPGGMAGMGGASGPDTAGSGGGMKDDQGMMATMQHMMRKMDQMMGMGGSAASPTPFPSAAPAPMPMMDDDMDITGTSGAAMPTQSGGMTNMPILDKVQAKGMSRISVGMKTGVAACGLAGFPGASHIYHIGATSFFLDHATHITPTVEQPKQLGAIKVQSLFNQATLERKIEQAEQDLMELTCSEALDAGKVEFRAKEIRQLQAEQRVAFIREVGRAASVLTGEQRQQLTSIIEPNPTPEAQPPRPGAMSGMPDM